MTTAAVTTEGQPRSVPNRAVALVAISQPRRGRRREQGSPGATLMVAGATSALRVATTVVPYRAVSRAVDEAMGGPAVTPEQVAERRRMILLGNAATVAVGVLAQRAVTHSRWQGPPADLARATAAQVAVGGAASALTVLADMAGVSVPDDPQDPSARATRAVSILARRQVLRRVISVVTLAPAPRTATIPVRSRWRTRKVELHLVQ